MKNIKNYIVWALAASICNTMAAPTLAEMLKHLEKLPAEVTPELSPIYGRSRVGFKQLVTNLSAAIEQEQKKCKENIAQAEAACKRVASTSEAEKSTITAEMKAKEEATAQLKKEIEESRQKLADLQAQLDNTQKAAAALEQEKNEAKKQLDSAKQKASDLTKESENVREELRIAKIDTDKAKEEANRAKEEASKIADIKSADLRRQSDALKAEKAKTEQALADATKQAATATAELEKVKAEKTALAAKMEEEQKKAVLDTVNNCNATLKAISEERNKFRDQNNELQENLKKLTAQIEELKKDPTQEIDIPELIGKAAAAIQTRGNQLTVAGDIDSLTNNMRKLVRSLGTSEKIPENVKNGFRLFFKREVVNKLQVKDDYLAGAFKQIAE